MDSAADVTIFTCTDFSARGCDGVCNKLDVGGDISCGFNFLGLDNGAAGGTCNHQSAISVGEFIEVQVGWCFAIVDNDGETRGAAVIGADDGGIGADLRSRQIHLEEVAVTLDFKVAASAEFGELEACVACHFQFYGAIAHNADGSAQSEDVGQSIVFDCQARAFFCAEGNSHADVAFQNVIGYGGVAAVAYLIEPGGGIVVFRGVQEERAIATGELDGCICRGGTVAAIEEFFNICRAGDEPGHGV